MLYCIPYKKCAQHKLTHNSNTAKDEANVTPNDRAIYLIAFKFNVRVFTFKMCMK